MRPAILPDWWDEECDRDEALLPELEIRVARFLGLPLAVVRDAAQPLSLPSYPEARLRRVRRPDSNRLAPAIHAAIRIAGAVVRSLRDPTTPHVPPRDGLAWRQQIRRAGTPIFLDDLLRDLWTRGIPVVPVEVLPAPSFQGIACVFEGRPVILLGHKHDEPGRIAYFIAHEAGHVAVGDCAPDQPVIDEDEEIADDEEMERRADLYATQVLIGGETVPEIQGADFKALAKSAAEAESSTGAEASALLFAWARGKGEYPRAAMAVKALYRGSGARAKLQQHFERHVDFDAASETDRALLRCVLGGAAHDAAAA